MKHIFTLIVVIFTTSFAVADSAQPVYTINFADYVIGSEEDWLSGKGFKFKNDMLHKDRINLEIDIDALKIEAKRHAFGIMLNEAVNIKEFIYVEIDWGVNQFPSGASYEKGVRNEAIMVFIFMGDEKQPSGSVFIPNSPFFVGLYLCHGDDRVNHPYVGSYYKKSGRYVCGDSPTIGEMVTTRFNLLDAYRSYYDKENDDDPAISGIALALDTKKASNGGKSSAFIREIRFYN